jgi:hypothetical protein
MIMATESCDQPLSLKKPLHKFHILATIALVYGALRFHPFTVVTGTQLWMNASLLLIIKHCMGRDVIECQPWDDPKLSF